MIAKRRRQVNGKKNHSPVVKWKQMLQKVLTHTARTTRSRSARAHRPFKRSSRSHFFPSHSLLTCSLRPNNFQASSFLELRALCKHPVEYGGKKIYCSYKYHEKPSVFRQQEPVSPSGGMKFPETPLGRENSQNLSNAPLRDGTAGIFFVTRGRTGIIGRPSIPA